MRRRGLVLAYLMRFKQICNHPSQWLGDGAYAPAESGKFARLAEIARGDRLAPGEGPRLHAVPRDDGAARALPRGGVRAAGARAHGRDHGPRARRARAAASRRTRRSPFFVLSLKAGGTGLNLTAATHVIHFDRWWNPAVENQATDRAFRIGQKKGVLVHKLVCRGTVEERIDAMLEDKRKLSRELLEGGDEVRLTELDDRRAARARLAGLAERGVGYVNAAGGNWWPTGTTTASPPTCRSRSAASAPRGSSPSSGRRATSRSRSRSTAAPSPRPSGERPGATTSSRTQTSRTACRAAGPTCGTAPSSISRSPRARSARSSPAASSTT